MASRPYALIAALVGWFGLVLQCYLSLRLAASDGRSLVTGLVDFLSFFTVLSNILVCLALTLPLIASRSAAGGFFATPFAVAGIAAAIAFVALSYHFLLRNIWNPQGAQLVADRLLHYVTPALFVAYWVCYRRQGTLRWPDPFLWGIYPTVYFVYVMVRGEIVGRYPYGFIDVSAIGYQRTIINALALLFAFIVLGYGCIGLDRWGVSRPRVFKQTSP